MAVTETGSSWIFRYTAPDGRRREMGLGPAHRDTLAAAGTSVALARKAVDAARDLTMQGIDPIDRRRAEREAAQAAVVAAKAVTVAEKTTLARVARKYHEEVIEPQRTKKHGAQWISSLENNVPAAIWHAPIDRIEPKELLQALAKLQLRVPETCRRVRQRLEVVFDDAQFHKLCSANPARVIKQKLAERPVGREKGFLKALAYAQVPAFVKALRQQSGTAARALEFALLTAARTGEVLHCPWSEIDTQTGVWAVPSERMKAKEAHTVYLSQRAVAIVELMRESQGEPWIFPSPTNREKPLSDMSMLMLLKRMGLNTETTVHGLCRATFSTWANETGAARPDVIEACLAHKETDRVRASYNRASFAAERKALLRSWADFCEGLADPVEVRPTASIHQIAAFA